MVPLPITVQQDQTNGFPPCSRHGIPDIAAAGTAISVESHIPVNGVAAGAGTVVPPRLNAVQRVVRIRNTAIPGKMPAQILNISCPGSAASIWLVSTGNLIFQPCGIVSVICKVEQHNAFLCGSVGFGFREAVIFWYNRKII